MKTDQHFITAVRLTIGMVVHLFGFIGLFTLAVYFLSLPALPFHPSLESKFNQLFNSGHYGVFAFYVINVIAMVIYRLQYGSLFNIKKEG